MGILYNKYRWFKYTLLLAVISVSLLKFFDIDIWLTPSIDIFYYLLFVYIIGISGLIYEISNLIYLNKYIKLRNLKAIEGIEIYHDFIINWLTGLFLMSKNKDLVRVLKFSIYWHISFFSITLLLTTLFILVQ